VFLPIGLAKPEEDRAGFLFRLQADQQHRTGVFEISEADAGPGAGDGVSQEVGFFTGVLARPEVDVVRAQHRPSELRIAVSVFKGESAPGQHAD